LEVIRNIPVQVVGRIPDKFTSKKLTGFCLRYLLKSRSGIMAGLKVKFELARGSIYYTIGFSEQNVFFSKVNCLFRRQKHYTNGKRQAKKFNEMWAGFHQSTLASKAGPAPATAANCLTGRVEERQREREIERERERGRERERESFSQSCLSVSGVNIPSVCFQEIE
jgi:hypothetical protein